MQGITLLTGIIAFITAVIIAIKAIYKKDLTLIGKLLGLVYIIVAITTYIFNPKMVELEFLHLGVIIYLLGDLFANSLYLMLRKQTDKIRRLEVLKTLADLSEKYYSIVENTPMGFYVFDTDGRMEYINSYLCELLGYKKEEVIGRFVYDFVSDDYKSLVKENVRLRMLGQQKTMSYVVKLVKKDGTHIFVKVIGTKTVNGHDTITGSAIKIQPEDIDLWKSQLSLSQ